MKCKLAENSINITANGSIIPCCRFAMKAVYDIENIETKDSIKNINSSSTFYSVQQDLKNDKWPTGCLRCARDESLNIPSRRQIYNKRITKNNIRVIDIDVGNFCNLKCIMCNSEFSTQWHSDQEFLYNNGFDKDYKSPKSFFSRNISNSDINKIVEYIESENTDVEIELKGGEPLALPNSKYLVDRLTSVKNKVDIIITSNGTFFPTWFEDICKKSNVRLSLSIDGLNEIYDYVRGTNRYNYNLFHNNVENFKNTHVKEIFFNFVVQNTNVHQLAECIYKYPDILVNPIFLQNPKWLQVWNMPEESKMSIINSLQDIPKDYKFYKKIQSVVDNMTILCDSEEYKKFIKFTSLLDKRRNKELPKIAPHLFTKDSLNEYRQLKDMI